MRIDQLYAKLKNLGFINNFYVANKRDKETDELVRIVKIYAEDGKLAEIYLGQMCMFRTTYSGFEKLNLLQRQALANVLVNFCQTPLDQRQSELYFVYYTDLNNTPHFIKRLANQRFTDDVIPFAFFKTLTQAQRQPYLFHMAEFDEFPVEYRPKFTTDTFVKAIPYEELTLELAERFPDAIQSQEQD